MTSNKPNGKTPSAKKDGDRIHDRVATAMTDAAQGLLDVLSSEQRQKIRWPFPSDDERRRWYYTPTDHGGLALADMNPTQQQAVQKLLASGLSEAGYTTASVIMGLENVLDRVEGFSTSYGRLRGRDPLMYWVAVFGHPGSDGPWSWRFGGHHISLHFTLAGGQVRSATPCFFGADPAASPLLGPHMLRPLGGAEDLGRELIQSFDRSVRATALVSSVAPTDIIGANRSRLRDGDRMLGLTEIWRGQLEATLHAQVADAQRRAESIAGLTENHLDLLSLTDRPKGLSATAMSPDEKEILRALLSTYVGRIDDDLADAQAARFAGDRLDSLSFLWAGGIEPNEPHYYRIQGAELLVEYDNTQRGVNHIHTVWRDLLLDFGGDPLAEHYAEGHHRRGV